jgi:hypothetical protein
VRVDTMPWHSPEQILSIASTHMTPENYKIMLKSAATQLNGI